MKTIVDELEKNPEKERLGRGFDYLLARAEGKYGFIESLFRVGKNICK